MNQARLPAYGVMSLAAALVVIALVTIAQMLEFDGDLVALLKSDSTAQEQFAYLQTAFQPFSSDEVVLLETDDLTRRERFDALQEIVIEFQLVPGVDAALSVFSLPDPLDGRPILGNATQDTPAQLLARLDQSVPAASQMIAQDRSMTLVIIMPEDREGLSPQARGELHEIVAEFGGGAFNATFVGLPEAYRHLQHALLEDQLRLMPFAIVISLLVAGLLFRSWRAAVLCTTPPLVALVLFMGVLAGLGLRITTVISLVPLLILVLGISNMLHFYLALRDAMLVEPIRATRHALRIVAPPCILSGLTTAIAFATFSLTGFTAMQDLALAGMIGLGIQTIAVLVLAPAVTVLLGMHEHLPAAPPRWLAAPVGPALRLSARRPLVIGLSLMVLGGAIWGHLAITPGHSMQEHLLRDGEVARAEARIAGHLGGTGQRFLVLTDPDGRPGLSDADLAALAPVVALFADLGAALPQGAALAALRDLAEDEIPPVMRRFVSEDALHYAIPLVTPLVQSASDSLEEARALDLRLERAGFQDQAHVTGLSHLAALEIPRMIVALKQGMVLTILLVTAVVIVVARSLWLGFAALVVNSVPVLGIEALLWLTQQPLTMTAAVALTIAFGVAVDDSLHMLNRYRVERRRNRAQAVSRSLHLVGVPIAASTLLIVACLAVTQASLLPSVATFGMIVCTAMMLAYLADMFLLPAFLAERKGTRE